MFCSPRPYRGTPLVNAGGKFSPRPYRGTPLASAGGKGFLVL